jgi:hypothetical protein
MPYMTVPDANYTFDASARTITLLGVHSKTIAGDIIAIRNVTTGDLIYDSRIQYGPSIPHISVTDGVISYYHGIYGHADTDKLQIIVNPRYVAQDFNELRVVEGEFFRNGQYMSIASGGTNYILIKTSTKCAHVNFSVNVDGDTHIELYLTPGVTANGTEMASGNFNLNYLLTKLALTKLYYTPTLTSEGTYLANTWAFGGSGTNPSQSTTAVSSTGGEEVILAANTDYLLKFINTAARTLQLWFEIEFHECEGAEEL